MAYTPAFNDIPNTSAAPINASGGYIPALQDIHDVENTQTALPPQSSDTLLNNPLANYYKGFAHSIGALGTDVADLIPGVNVKMPQLGSGTAYNLGNIGGNVGAFAFGGEGLDAIRAAMAAKDLPFISQAADLLGGDGISGITRRAIGTTGYGVLTNPNDPLKGGLEGTAASLIGDAIPGVGGLVGKGINAIQPQKLSDQIVGALGGGKSLEENAQSIAQDVNNSFKQRTAEGGSLYQPIFNSVGNNSIYDGMIPENSAYQSLDTSIPNSYNRNLSTLHQQFMGDPTFNNAHSLQSELGSAIRKLQGSDAKGTLSEADRNTLQGYQSAQNSLRSDMNNFLTSQSPDLANQYNQATANWAQNVAPYYENPKISLMAKGELTNPASLQSIFKNPEPEVQKVVSDLPDDAKNRVLYSMLGKTNATKSPENLVNAFKQLDQQGLGSYVSPSLEDQIKQLGTQIKARNVAQGAAGAGLALTFLPHFMSPELVGAASVGGGFLGPMIARASQRMMPNTQFLPTLTNALRNSYGAARTAVIPNVVGGNQ